MAHKKSIHLVCNSHIDPVWLWEWQEGVHITLATFRSAVRFCTHYRGFVFNHNEAKLYEWVQEYDPELFAQIKELVQQGRWHIMGGCYLQPDCNMPAGETFLRQILYGKLYFRKHFGVEVKDAMNFDPFGHSRGLVQILVQGGYGSYLFCRPLQADCPLPADEFVWQGYDGSEILATRASSHYNSRKGEAYLKVRQAIAQHPEKPCTVLLWGVGNHGGGASEQDIQVLESLIQQEGAYNIHHSTPAAYFGELAQRRDELALHAGDLNSWAVGCYSSQSRIKRLYRRAESDYLLTEKIAATTYHAGLRDYPTAPLRDALRDILDVQFHDILPGTSIQPVEDYALGLLHRARLGLAELRHKSFMALCRNQPPARGNSMPILLYNPHPFEIEDIFECELQPEEPNRGPLAAVPQLWAGSRTIAVQNEKPLSNLLQDFRKKLVFRARLPAGALQRFDCNLLLQKTATAHTIKIREGRIDFRTEFMQFIIDATTGLPAHYEVHGTPLLLPGAFRPLVIHDNEDPWGMRVCSFRNTIGAFTLLDTHNAPPYLSGENTFTRPVEIIEDGPVRTVVEARFVYGISRLVLTYKLPKQGSELEVEARVYWNETNRMLKLALPTRFPHASCVGQDIFGVKTLPANGDECCAQQWTAVLDARSNMAISLINDGCYGFDYTAGEMRVSLLRAAAYAAHPVKGQEHIVAQGRFTPRIDQGEHAFRFWLNAGPCNERLERISREAQAKHEAPIIANIYPNGSGDPVFPAPVLSDPAVLITAFKKAEQSDALIIRLFNPTKVSRTIRLELPAARASTHVDMAASSVHSLAFSPRNKSFTTVNIIEDPL